MPKTMRKTTSRQYGHRAGKTSLSNGSKCNFVPSDPPDRRPPDTLELVLSSNNCIKNHTSFQNEVSSPSSCVSQLQTYELCCTALLSRSSSVASLSFVSLQLINPSVEMWLSKVPLHETRPSHGSFGPHLRWNKREGYPLPHRVYSPAYKGFAIFHTR